MPWFKTVNQYILRVQGKSGRGKSALGFGTDAAGKEIVIGPQAALAADTSFSNGTTSHYGSGSIVMLTAGGIKIVDAEGLWQTPTITAASASASPSASGSPSSSRSPSASSSPSASVSPSASASPST